ncbi:MAG TPA: hypothetical protein PLO88_00825, partial [Bacilli bacterium]|nr:hypothetical protein [Bacilli bacterium]
MKNIISCHLSYLLNKVTIITLIVVLIMSGLGFYYAGEYLTNSHSLSLANDYYYYHSFFVIKLLGIFVFVFMVGNSFLLKNDHYSHLLLTANISRTYYFGSKILSIGLLIAGFIWIVFVLFVIVGFFRSHNFIYDNNLFWRFVNLCLFFWY